MYNAKVRHVPCVFRDLPWIYKSEALNKTHRQCDAASDAKGVSRCLSEASSGTKGVIRYMYRQHGDLISGRARMDVKTSLREYRRGAYFKGRR